MTHAVCETASLKSVLELGLLEELAKRLLELSGRAAQPQVGHRLPNQRLQALRLPPRRALVQALHDLLPKLRRVRQCLMSAAVLSVALAMRRGRRCRQGRVLADRARLRRHGLRP